jgi:hypothetical protein
MLYSSFEILLVRNKKYHQTKQRFVYLGGSFVAKKHLKTRGFKSASHKMIALGDSRKNV